MTDIFGTPVHLDTIWVKFEGQGQRSQEENKSSAISKCWDRFWKVDLN